MTAKQVRPNVLPSVTYETKTQCGKLYVTISHLPTGEIFEVFCRFGKAGGCGAAVFDGVTKLLSYALRSGMEPKEAVKAFQGISCNYGPNTCLNAMAEIIDDFLK